MKVKVNKIYNKDCLEGLKEIPDNSIDLIITDPPYNISQHKNISRKSFSNFFKGNSDIKFDFGGMGPF